MNSLILNRINRVLDEIYQDNPNMDIQEVMLSPPMFHKLLIEAHERYSGHHHMTHGGSAGFNAIQLHCAFGSVAIKASTDCIKYESEIMFRDSKGKRIFPLDDMIDRILLGIK